jgi:hypothetical protein
MSAAELMRAKAKLERYAVAGRPAGFVVELPPEFVSLFGVPAELDLRLLKNEAGCVITIAPSGRGLYSASEASSGNGGNA